MALAHCIFNVPLAVWILEGFVSGVPREIDETAFLDGYSFPRFFIKIFVPLIASGIGVAAFFCFMFSWVELLLARTLTAVNAKPIAAVMTRTVSAAGMDWGLLAAAGVLTIIPGALVIWFVRNYIAQAASRSAGCEGGPHGKHRMDGLDAADRDLLRAASRCTLAVMTRGCAIAYPEAERVGILRIPTTRGDRLFISLIMAAVIHLLWIGLVGTDTIATLPVGEESIELSSLWLATVISLVSAVAIFRTV